jgi:hypothetical protein
MEDRLQTLIAALLFLAVTSGTLCAADKLSIQKAVAPGQVEIFFDAVSTNEYRILRGNTLTNFSIHETIVGASGRVGRTFPSTGATALFALQRIGPTPPLDGFGGLTGNAFVLDDELTNSASSFFGNILDFAGDPFDVGTDDARLTPGGRSILAAGASGGSSLLSEVFAFEVLARSEGAALVKTEAEILYQNLSGKKADFLVNIDGVKIGVTVTRAVTFPLEGSYTVAMAETLLNRKLADILAANANVQSADSWSKQILSIIAYSPDYIEVLRTAWGNVGANVKANTILLVTGTNGSDSFLY